MPSQGEVFPYKFLCFNMEEPRLDVIHSVESKIHSPVRFINSTGRKVNIVWLNFSGNQVSYGILDENKQLLNMNTFVTHPWIAIDEENKQRMWLNSVDVFYPPTPQYVRVRHGNQIGRRIHRMSVPITVPGRFVIPSL